MSTRSTSPSGPRSSARTPGNSSTRWSACSSTPRARSSSRPTGSSGWRCPNHPNVELQWLTEKNWFFRLSAYQDRLLDYYAKHPDWVAPEYRKNEMLAFIRAGLDDISISRETFHWGIPFPIAENGETAQREDGSWDPEAGVIYVWFDALINYITGAGLPDDPEG